MPHPLSHKCPIPISPLCLTSHFTCVQIFHMVSIDVPAGVGAPPVNTTTPVSPTPILSTYYRSVPFRLLMHNVKKSV